MVNCVVYDMRIFILSILSIIGWLTFTISFAVLLNDYNTTVFGGSKEINALTFVHFALACFGWLVNVFSVFMALRKGKNAILGTVCVFCTALMVTIAGGVANDYGRVFYTLTLGGKISADHLVPDALKAAMAGVCMFLMFEMFKLLCFFHRKTNGVSLPYTRN